MPGLGIEGGGLVNIGAQKVMGLNYVTNAVGANFKFNEHLTLGACYEYQLSTRTMLLNNVLNVQLILRY